MKKLLLFLFLPVLCMSQIPELCDSIEISLNQYNIIDDIIEINVNTEYSSSYSFPYSGFMVTNNEGDTVAAESIASANNVYGISGNMSETRSLEVIGEFVPPFNGTIHLVSYFFAGNPAIMCSWPFSYTSGFTYIPDDEFEQKMIDLELDDLLDNYVLTSNINGITYLDLSYLPITDLTGIEDFSQLETLICSGTLVTELDVSNNLSLTVLECNFGDLTNLNVSNNTSLLHLECGGNNLSELDVSNNVNLTHLTCSENNLSELNLSSNLQLEGLWCEFNNLYQLDVSNNTVLSYLFCNDNNLSQLDLLNNLNLTYLFCQNNNFTCVQIWDPVYAEENENFFNGGMSWSLDCDYENQTPFQSIIVEEIDNDNLVEGQTYRVYAKIGEGQLTGYWANENNGSHIQTSTSFHVDGANLWGDLPDELENKKIQRGINTDMFDLIPSSRYTSWLTLGDSYSAGTVVCPYNAVFHKSDNFELGVEESDNIYLLNYIGESGESGFVRLAETNYLFINDNYLYYSTPQNAGWFPYGGNPNGLIQGDYCASSVLAPDEDGRILLFQMTTTGAICGLINLSGTYDDGSVWNESGIEFLIANGNITDCDGNCITDVDEDLICDEIDDCVGAYDECGICNGSGAELYYDCDGICLNDVDGDTVCDEIEIVGCDDINSCNYDPLSTDIFCTYPELYYDCNDNCLNDLDLDLICDEIDDCVGEYDDCGICNGPGLEDGYDCDGNCVNGYTSLTLVWTSGLNSTFSVTGETNGLLYAETLTTETGYLTECWLTDLQADCFTINIEGDDELVWELYSDNVLVLEGDADNMFFGSECETGCTDQAACGNYNPFALIDDESCEYPGDECVGFDVALQEVFFGIFDDNCNCILTNTSLLEASFNKKKIIAIVDVVGKEITNTNSNNTVLYIFDDGSIEKKHHFKY